MILNQIKMKYTTVQKLDVGKIFFLRNKYFYSSRMQYIDKKVTNVTKRYISAVFLTFYSLKEFSQTYEAAKLFSALIIRNVY